MQTQENFQARESGNSSEPVLEEFLKMLRDMREEVHSIGSDMRVVVEENATLKDEVAKLRDDRNHDKPLSEAQRIKEECYEGLARLREQASRTRSTRQRTGDRVMGSTDHTEAGAPWLKKMMMFMMMTELV